MQSTFPSNYRSICINQGDSAWLTMHSAPYNRICACLSGLSQTLIDLLSLLVIVQINSNQSIDQNNTVPFSTRLHCCLSIFVWHFKKLYKYFYGGNALVSQVTKVVGCFLGGVWAFNPPPHTHKHVLVVLSCILCLQMFYDFQSIGPLGRCFL